MADLVIRNKKLIKAGNSYAITVEKSFVDQYFDGGKADVTMELDRATGRVTFVNVKNLKASKEGKLSKAEKSAVLESKLPKEFRDWVEKSLEEDAESMKALANL